MDVANEQIAASADHAAAFVEGRRLAAYTGRAPGSADVLLGLLRAGGAAARLLTERGITAARLEAHLPALRPDPPTLVSGLARDSHAIAAHLGARRTTSLHLLLALLRAGGAAVEALRLSGVDPARVRAIVMRALTGPGRFDERQSPRGPSAGNDAVAPTVSPMPGVPPSLPSPGARERPAPDIAREPGGPVPMPSLGGTPEFVFIDPPSVPVMHRDREIGRLLDLLRAAPRLIPCLIGEPGAGKSALLAALAGASEPAPIAPVDTAAASGTTPGAYLWALHRAAPPDLPIALDGGASLFLGMDGSDGPAQLLAAARAGRRWILTLTPADVRRLELSAPDLCAQLERVPLEPLSPDALFEVTDGGLEGLQNLFGVSFAPGLSRTLLRLSGRYPSERAQPGRALAIAEIAAARAGRLGRDEVAEVDVATVVADAAGVPVAQLLRTDDERFRGLEERMAERVVGHEEARGRIGDLLRRSYAGFRGRRPLASLLLLGPTGVGKTETARAIADALFDGSAALLRIDLSEYNEPHSVARLIGSPPGYVGHEDGGQLTEGIRRRPASVVLLDELEKAHRDVLLLLLQVLEDGRLTDGRGRTVDFSSAAIVMTSNLGAELYRRSKTPPTASVTALARTRLPPELWNRIDDVLCYAPLSEAELRQVVAKLAMDSCARLDAERGIRFRIDDSVIAEVLRIEPDRTLGARPLRRAFERLVEGPVAAQILAGHVRAGARLALHCDGRGDVVVSWDREPAPSSR